MGITKKTVFITLAAILICLCSVPAIAASPSLSKGSVTMQASEKVTLKLNGATASKVTWASSNKAVATVSGGTVKAIKKGTANIVATYNKKSYTCKVEVISVSLNKKSATLWVGETLSLKLNGATASKVKWSTSDKAVATVTATGMIKAIKKGNATVYAKYGTKTFSAAITVIPQPVITGKPSNGLLIGDTVTLKVSYAKGLKTTWSSSNKAVATITQAGVVRGIKQGKAVITAKTGTATTSFTVNVTPLIYNTSGMSALEKAAYEKMYAFVSRYPEGMAYDNSQYYQWNGGIYNGGYGCAGFAFELSDAAFGKTPAKIVGKEKYGAYSFRVGDILRMENHSVIIMGKASDGFIVGEGNYNSCVHWGRKVTKSEISKNIKSGKVQYIMTRY